VAEVAGTRQAVLAARVSVAQVVTATPRVQQVTALKIQVQAVARTAAGKQPTHPAPAGLAS